MRRCSCSVGRSVMMCAPMFVRCLAVWRAPLFVQCRVLLYDVRAIARAVSVGVVCTRVCTVLGVSC